MAYGILKCDNITFDNGGSDQNVTVSGLYRATTSGVTVTGTISGAVLVGTTTVSGATVTGTVVQGTTVQGVSGTFTSLTGTTTSGTTANFVSGVFTTQVSGTTITGTTSSFTSGNFATLSGATATFTSGVIASGTATNPSLSILGDPNTGAYSPGADQLGIVTNGVERIKFGSTEVVINDGGTDYDLRIEGDTNSTLFCVDASTDRVGIGTSSPTTILDVNGDVKAAGIFSSAAGTATAPSIAFTGDLNTGIYSPGADQLAVSTGGTGRLFVDASGNVGIGTSSPRGLVSISNNVIGTGVVDSSLHLGFSTLDYYGFRIVNSNEPTSTGAGLLKFQRGNTASWLDALVINNSGNVGIGTTSPRFALSIGSSVSSQTDTPDTLDLGATYTFTPGASPKLRVYDDGVDIYGLGVSPSQLEYICPTSTSHVFFTAGTERVRVTSAGNVGIGTSSPSSILEVMAAPDTVGTTNGIQANIANPGLTPTQINSTTIGIGVTGQAVNFAGDSHIRSFWGFSIDKGAGNLSSGASNSVNADSRTFAIRQYAGGTTWNTQFCVNGSGNVGIGTTSPTTLLDVNTDTVRVRTARTPASATATGATGEICWDASYIYVCTATNTWQRSAISSW